MQGLSKNPLRKAAMCRLGARCSNRVSPFQPWEVQLTELFHFLLSRTFSPSVVFLQKARHLSKAMTAKLQQGTWVLHVNPYNQRDPTHTNDHRGHQQHLSCRTTTPCHHSTHHPVSLWMRLRPPLVQYHPSLALG